jgi:hypothetical protein
MKNDTTSQRVFNLVIYSHVPFFLVLALTHLFPQLLFLNLFGAYSFFLFWSGIDKMTEIEPENKLPFLLSSSLIMISLFFLLNFIFNNIYDTILGQLSIFAGL